MPDPRAPAPAYPHGALPIGTRLGEFEVRRVLGVGGFGIVYLAFDHLLEREVALKEYMPSALADRAETMHVSLISQANADTFALGLRSFVNEARLLARFDHPSLVKVHRFWEANGTAYMAMALYKGRTVRDVRLEMKNRPDEAWVRRILEPLLGAVERLHSEDVFHRDIAPDNILIEGDGRPVLLDFGAARRVISDRSQALTAILKPSYAPIEQYADVSGMKQGAWTDIYALGATMHFLLLGKPPPPAPGRSIQDIMPSLASQRLAGCSPEFLDLIDWMLTPLPTERPQSVAAVRDVLEGRSRVPSKAPPVQADDDLTLPLGTRAAPDGATVVLPRGQTAFPPRADEATVIMPRGGGSTGFNPGTRATPPDPPKPPVADEDATVVTAYPTGYHTQRQPPAPPPVTQRQPAAAAPDPVPKTRAAAPAPRAPAGQTVHMTKTVAPQPAGGASWLMPVLAGVGVAAAVGGGLWWFLTRPASTPVLPAPPSASAPAALPTPAASAAVPTALPASASAPVPPTAAAPVPVPAAPSAAAEPSRPAAQTPPVRPTPTAPPPRTQQRAPEPQPPAAKTAEPTPPAPAPTPSPQPTVAVTPPAPAPAPPPAPEAPRSPSERCAKELPLVRLICIDLACNRNELKQHPECIKLRADQAGKRSYEGGN